MNADAFENLADELGLDDFERIAAQDILVQLETATSERERERLHMDLGALVSPHIDGWIT